MPKGLDPPPRFQQVKQGSSPQTCNSNNPHLYDQGIWIFGDWDKALRAARFDPERTRIRSSADEERIVKEIRTMRRENLPLNAHYVLKHRPKLFSAAVRHFGSWL